MNGKDFLGVSPVGLEQSRLERLPNIPNASNKVNSNKHLQPLDRVKQTKDAATDFEALVLQQMFSTMWKQNGEEGVFDSGYASQMYRDLFVESMAKEAAKSSSTGIKQLIFNDMQKLEKK